MTDKIIIDIFDDITGDTLKRVVHSTQDLPDGADVELRIASYGGEILPTISIIETLKRFHTHANVLGFACSAAAILAISCEECTMSENASMLLHSAWSEDADSSDPGIRRCNDVQLQIIKSRCPDFDPKDIQKDTWLSAEDCLKMHLADSIYTSDPIDYAALCKRYAAKLCTYHSLCKEETMEEEVKEVVEEVKEEAAEQAAPEVPEENHDLVEVIEKLSEELNALKARVVALEEVKEEVKEEEQVEAECGDPNQDRINNIFKSIVAPQARVAIGTPKAACTKVVQKVDYKAFKSFIND